MTQTWDQYFMELADVAARRSKDQSTKLGAIVVGPDQEIRATGYNSFPRKIRDNLPERQARPWKYKFVEHAERNAIYAAARVGTPLKGCTIYCAWPPCTDCARGIIQAGIIEIVVRTLEVPDRWKEDMGAAMEMLLEARVSIREMA
jgi:dCMP deaminase